ncbi:MAG: inorganic phosphate transporter [Eubacteriales bacterium]
MLSISLIIVVILAVTFDFINGFHDTANSIATTVSTRVLTPAMAIVMAASFNFLGALASEKVAKTISKGLIDGHLEQYVIMAALLAAITWNLITWYIGIPSSSSHALIGGLIGSSIIYAMSFKKVLWDGVFHKIIIPLFTSPLIGFIFGFTIMWLLYRLLSPFTHTAVNRWFSKFQIVSAIFVSFSHGKNDAQKSMGIITLALVSAGILTNDDPIPLWVKITCALAMAFGTSVGGWKIIKTMGTSITKLEPIGGFAAQTAAAIVIEAASELGAPISTTQVISTAIMGVGASKRFSAVKWIIAKNIVWAWIITLPITACFGAIFTLVLKFFYTM